MKKLSYEAPEGLIRVKHSRNWYVKRPGIYKSTGTSNYEKALKILIEVDRRLDAKKEKNIVDEILADCPTFKQLIDRYHKEVASLKGHPELWRANYPLQFLGHRYISTIKLQDVYQYQDWRRSFNCNRKKRPVTGATVNREVALIRHTLQKAVRWGMIEHNPIERVEGLSENHRDRYITQTEWDAIKTSALKYRKSRHMADIMDVLYHTGQRCGKILSLKWTQVDLSSRMIRFEHDSKNKKAPEVIWINDILLTILARLRGERTLKKVVGPYVFEKDNGKPYLCVRRTWKRCCRDAKVENARLHDIRHCAITDMLASGWSVAQVGRVVGHANTSTTDRYTHLQVETTKGPLESLAIAKKGVGAGG